MAGSSSEHESDRLSGSLPGAPGGEVTLFCDFLLNTLERVPNLVYFMDPQGRAGRFNPAVETITGYSASRLESDMPFLQAAVHPDSRAAMQPSASPDVPVAEIDYRLLRSDGELRWMRSYRLAVKDGGRLYGFICVDRDTTEQHRAEAALRTERDRAREYLDIADVILVAIDADRRVSMINRKGCETLGYSEAEIVGTSWFDNYVPEKDRAATSSTFDDLIHGRIEAAEHYENPVLCRDGRQRLISWHNTLLRRPDGTISGTLSSGEDITEKRHAEELLRRTEEEFRALFEGTASCILFTEGPVIRYANEAMLRTFGYTRDELIGQDVRHLHVSLEKYQEAYRAAYETVQRSGSWRGDWPLKRKDGTTVWMDNFLTRLSRGGIVAVLHDITERFQAEQALRHREAELSSIFRAAPVGIGLTADRIIRQANDKLCEMLGYTRFELIGSSSRLLYPDDSSFEFVGNEKYRQIREGGTGTVETQWRRKDGRIIDVLLSSTPVDPEDWSRGITFTALDITERKKAEQALLEKNIALREVLNQISADQDAIREQIATNIGEAILPMLARLQESAGTSQAVLVDQLRKDFEEISSPFLETLKNRQPRLTPRETEICRLIKNGMTSKQIADSLSLSLGTVHKYRELIRRKLGLANVDVNLASYLQSL